MVAAGILTNDGAFDRLYVTEYARVAAIAFRVVGDRADAEDVAQEAFAQCARNGRAGRPGAEAWLATAAVHHAINLLRSRRRRIAREISEHRLNDSLREARERSADPISILDQAQSRALVRAAMLRLSHRDAAVLALRYSGSSYREIGETLGIDPNQVGTRLVRAERAFRKEIEHARG
ncbi:MAG TPA: sigma-70 family RNA polymerase sigma factor [Candidatus Acidoferrales bacterium]|nr:sigma-70 family RNA polymerase sigma factor [Candidatus Acidoferrales bacterium]